MEEERQEEETIDTSTETPKDESASNPQRTEELSRRSFGKRKKGRFDKRYLLIIIVIAAIAAGVWFLLRDPKIEVEPLSEEETIEETSEPTSKPTSQPVDREEISINILNGTGIPKEASLLQGKLRDLGYTDIEVGNADTKDFVVTEATFSSKVPDDVKDEIIEELEDTYKEVDSKTGSSATDITIIIGYKKGHTPTPSPAPTTAPTQTPTPTESISATPTPTP